MEHLIGTLLLLSTLLLFQINKIRHCVGILVFQSLVLSLITVGMWMKTGFVHLLITAILTVTVKAILIPLILYYTVKKTGRDRGVERITSKSVSFMVALLVSLVGFSITSRLDLPGVQYGQPYLSISIILILLGTFILIDHKKAIMQGVGLIIMENGLFLVAASICYGMPLIVELGIFFDLLVTVIVIRSLSLRIQSTFNSLNIENMRRLKG